MQAKLRQWHVPCPPFCHSLVWFPSPLAAGSFSKSNGDPVHCLSLTHNFVQLALLRQVPNSMAIPRNNNTGALSVIYQINPTILTKSKSLMACFPNLGDFSSSAAQYISPFWCECIPYQHKSIILIAKNSPSLLRYCWLLCSRLVSKEIGSECFKILRIICS